MKTICLNGVWSARCIPENGAPFAMPGQVPGSSIADLMRAGKLPADIFWRDHADAVQDYERCAYEYSRSFCVEPRADCRYTLRFERLDTYCRVYLNGVCLGERGNGNIAHEFDVTERLLPGENCLKVCFDSPIVRTDGLPRRAGAFTTERMNTRRMQCTYGWDWVARFVGCGIPGDVALVETGENEVLPRGVYIYTQFADEEFAAIGVDVQFPEKRPGRVLTLRVIAPGGEICRTVQRYCAEALMRVSFSIPAPQLWYPLGYGGQPLYALELWHGETCIHRESFGIRTVAIMQLPDENGSEYRKKCAEIQNPHYDFNDATSGFILKVNGKKILCQGANWVPCEPFHAGSTDAKITRALELAAQCGLNMLRVWGGGAFETAHFYSECSRLGIMVTQDFLMACGQYPEDEDWFIHSLRQEAEYAALALRNQPCLMWWSGDNENAVNGSDLDTDYMGRRSAYEGIAPVLYQLDPRREFLPSSPYGGVRYASNTVGTTHNTQFLGDDILPYMLSGDCADYRQAWKRFRARFIAEEPQLGAVSVNTLRRFMTGEDIFGADDSMWKFHTRSNPALPAHLYDISTRFAQSILGPFASAEDRCFKLRYLQYEWVRLSMEQLRREMWFCSGLIYWMYNDCWPAASGWALLDYYNQPKDAWYAFKRCAKPVVLSLDCADNQLALYVSNTGEAVAGAGIRLWRVEGARATEIARFTADIPAGQTCVVDRRAVALGAGQLLVAELTAQTACDRTFYQEGRLNLAPTEIQLSRPAGENAVIVSAGHYVHAVELEGDAIFEDNCFSLLPGESRKIAYTCAQPLEPRATAYTVMP